MKHSLFPVFISIVQIPLVAHGHNAFISRTRYNSSTRFVIQSCFTSLDHFLSDQIFSLSNLFSFECSDKHSSLVETFLVGLVFSLIKKNSIILTLNFKLLAKCDCSQISISRGIDQWNRLDCHHFLSNTILFSKSFFVSKITSRHPIVR